MDKTTPSEPSAAHLVQAALADARHLIELETRLAIDDAKRQIVAAKRGSIALGIAGGLGLVGLTLLLTALGLAIALGPEPLLVLGLALLAIAAVVGLTGWKRLPKHPLDSTRKRVEDDIHVIKERLA